MKRGLSIFPLVLIVSLSVNGQDMFWTRVAMDGSRVCAEKGELSGTAAREAELLDECAAKMAPMKEIIGYSPRAMSAYAPQSPLGNWFADLSLDQGEILCGEHCDVSIANVGGIRVDMPQGDVIVDDILSMFPFSSKIAVLKLKGSSLRVIFSRMASNGWEAFSGAKVVCDGQTLKSVEVGGTPLDDERIYTVVSNTFILDGGDNMYVGQNALECTIYDNTIYQFVRDFIKRKTDAGEVLSADVDDRLVLRETEPVRKDDEAKPSRRMTGTGKAHCLTILHTNDTHSHLEPVRSGEYAGFGGVVERAAFIDSVRRADGRKNVLLLDAGDYSQGTTYFTTFRGRVEVEAMNLMKYDVATIGNHEWDNGPRDLLSRLKKASFKTTLCNYDVADRDLASRLKPYAIVRRGGLKIGVIGTLVDVLSVVNRDVAKDIRYRNPVEPVNRWADYLKNKRHCDMVIVLSHCGLTQEYGDMWDTKMASMLHNVDLIVGGHTHTNLTEPVYVNDADGKPLMIVTDYLWGLYVGVIKI